ncbi:hypothetical protein LCGC14_2060100 [marine sediment metagenome]|uniref:Uncharacterized protein n=1 Tax=marine sediment metagenome TaxID=412755 RepID=A0A0F9F8V8_9ZZZZ
MYVMLTDDAGSLPAVVSKHEMASFTCVARGQIRLEVVNNPLQRDLSQLGVKSVTKQLASV